MIHSFTDGHLGIFIEHSHMQVSMKPNLRNIPVSNRSRKEAQNSVVQESEMVLFSFHRSLYWLSEEQIGGGHNKTLKDQLEGTSVSPSIT